VIALLFRLTGKRGLASLSMFDFVVIFLLSNVVRNRDHRQRHLPSMLGTPSAVSTSTPSQGDGRLRQAVIVSPPTTEPAPWIEDRAASVAQWLAELG
jgi:hypothetical protein